jgi:hypothetical protein
MKHDRVEKPQKVNGNTGSKGKLERKNGGNDKSLVFGKHLQVVP